MAGSRQDDGRKGYLPAPRPLLAPLRPVDSAQTSLSRLPDRRLLITIRHAPLEGVTPQMLAWWFKNIEGSIEVDGQTYSRYSIWHPYDHIHYGTTCHRDGSVSAGVTFHIAEAFGRDPSLRIESREQVDLLDATGLRLSTRFAGIEVFSLHHRFTEEPDGTGYDSTMLVGVAGRPGRVINPIINRRLFGKRHARAWIKHNIEEVGLLEQIVPALYEESGG